MWATLDMSWMRAITRKVKRCVATLWNGSSAISVEENASSLLSYVEIAECKTKE
jgi:hypothetical protein